MSGMAGNVTAFNTVWTYDIYQSYINKNASDCALSLDGPVATVGGIPLSIGGRLRRNAFNNIMDVLQLVFAFVNAPLFATFLLGMFWKRTTGHGAFTGLLSGTVAAALHHGLTLPADAVPASTAAGSLCSIFIPATWRRTSGPPSVRGPRVSCTIAVSLATRPREERELAGLVYSLTERPSEEHLAWYKRPLALGAAVIALTLVLNLVLR